MYNDDKADEAPSRPVCHESRLTQLKMLPYKENNTRVYRVSAFRAGAMVL
jgi:hypothetical protein